MLELLLPVLVLSALGSTLLALHRHGGARWMFALGGFFFILGRLAIVAICAFTLVVIIVMMRESDGDGYWLGWAFAIPLLGIGGWSMLVIFLAWRRDAFGSAHEKAARVRYADRNP